MGLNECERCSQLVRTYVVGTHHTQSQSQQQYQQYLLVTGSIYVCLSIYLQCTIYYSFPCIYNTILNRLNAHQSDVRTAKREAGSFNLITMSSSGSSSACYNVYCCYTRNETHKHTHIACRMRKYLKMELVFVFVVCTNQSSCHTIQHLGSNSRDTLVLCRFYVRAGVARSL